MLRDINHIVSDKGANIAAQVLATDAGHRLPRHGPRPGRVARREERDRRAQDEPEDSNSVLRSGLSFTKGAARRASLQPLLRAK